jgi:hypothetical protein
MLQIGYQGIFCKLTVAIWYFWTLTNHKFMFQIGYQGIFCKLTVAIWYFW